MTEGELLVLLDKLNQQEIDELMTYRVIGEYFEAVHAVCGKVRASYSWTVQHLPKTFTEPLRHCNMPQLPTPIPPSYIGELILAIELGHVSHAQALKEIFPRLVNGKRPYELIGELGLMQSGDPAVLQTAVEAAIAANPKAAADFRAGKQPALGALVGATMKHTKGLDAKKIREVISAMLVGDTA
jgi:aspartyl-tRNA(Asn)/glutamyl-tRNA(Gln) amidotransferase subunit B